jgi:hypothetical protein
VIDLDLNCHLAVVAALRTAHFKRRVMAKRHLIMNYILASPKVHVLMFGCSLVDRFLLRRSRLPQKVRAFGVSQNLSHLCVTSLSLCLVCKIADQELQTD